MKRRKPDHISQEDWDAVDSPELTEAMLMRMRPAREVMPDLLEAYEAGQLRTRGPQKAPTKVQLTVRYSREVVDYFRATGAGWQARMDEALRQWIHQHPKAG